MINIVLFGPPGAGKGTQSAKLVSEFGFIHLSTGDLLRSEIAQGTQLGMEAKALMDQGKLVPDAVVVGMIKSKLQTHADAKGFIFDGFPRTIAQAEALDSLLSELNAPISAMLSLVVEEDELIRRLLNRGIDSGRSDDQDENIIRNRIAEYNAKTAIVADYYSKQNKHKEISGMGSIEDIYHAIKKSIAV